MSVSRAIVVQEMRPDELEAASALLGVAYRDNPMMFVLYGDDPEVRRQTNAVVFERRIASMDPPPLVVRETGRLIGVCGFDPPTGSRMTQDDMVAIVQAMSAISPQAPQKMMALLADWRGRTPEEPHWNLGPVGVDPAYHGRGIGGAMITAFCEMLDRERVPGFLETDLEKNARLYARFGFEVIDHVEVLGLPMWFMWRPGR